MYLKTLKLAGFKSFADRTRLEMRPGVTVVVGPNGTGKSNLVDALSWVLGTQSPKSLRTPRMEDVIFAGTTARSPMNRAEVTLIVDNTERKIDLDLDEVSITRRLYRDGSSDYELNGVGCRLLDIQDLLSDSGVGRHQHVIIGQGEIGQVLSASPEDHRAVIEEAAGILKHRRRKERAMRRLERTDEDLTRLEDIIGEINRQMRPLRRQAAAAERYDQLKGEVVALRLYLGGQALRVVEEETAAIDAEKTGLSARLESEMSRLTDEQEGTAGLTEALSRVSEYLDTDSAAAARLETTGERLRRIAAISLERRRAAAGLLETQIERKRDLEDERASISSEMEELSAASADAETAAAQAGELFRRLEDQERAIASQTALSPEGALAAVRGELAAVEAALARDRREKESIDHRIEVLTAQVEEELDQIKAIDVEVRALDANVGSLQTDYERASRARSGDQAAWTAVEQTLSTARLELASAEARLEAIRSAMANGGESWAMAESGPGSKGPLYGLLDIPQNLQRAVSAALGGWADAVAFESSDYLRSAAASVKGSGGGAVCLVSPRRAESASVSAPAGGLGVGALVNLLGPHADHDLASALLGDVVVVEGWEAAWDLVRSHPHLRAVTPEGDLVTRNGLRIAEAPDSGHRMLKAAEDLVEEAKVAFARAESAHTAARRDFENSRARERETLEALEMAEAAMSGRSEAMVRLRQSVLAFQAETERLTQRRQALTISIDAATAHIEEMTVRLDSLQGEEAEITRVWEDMERRRRHIAAERETARADWQEVEGRLREILGRRRLLEDRLDHVIADLGRLDQSEPTAADPSRLEQVERVARKAQTIIEGKLHMLRDRQAALREEKNDLETRLRDSGHSVEMLRRSIDASRERLGQIEVRLTELRMQRESVIESIRRDANGDEVAALGAPRPEIGEDDLESALDERLARLARQGPVNPLAAEEYSQLSERFEFLSSQKADVEASRAELRKVISVLEEEIQRRFGDAFEAVARSFERYVRALFPGGRGRIRLLDPDDPESGVTIEAQPQGKKLAQMSLLSGGERSLAALAFLFAIFEARPSPFYVLDEVEAALDDANLRRFLRVVDEFRDKAQLVIVTHQQQTMEAADVLYGVTMEPGGSSQVLRKEMRAAVA